MIALLGLAGTSSATSPMPEELKPGQTEPYCTLHVVYRLDREQGIFTDEQTSTLTFEHLLSRKDILEKITHHMNATLNEDNISEFKVECKFPKK
jgi:hypothetical protein